MRSLSTSSRRGVGLISPALLINATTVANIRY
jgi:hypothetical protein